MNISVPNDGRPQFDPSVVMITNALAGRSLTAGVETVTPDGRYILANTWPQPRPSGGGGGFSSLAASQAAPETKPRTAASALWPNLPSAG